MYLHHWIFWLRKPLHSNDGISWYILRWRNLICIKHYYVHNPPPHRRILNAGLGLVIDPPRGHQYTHCFTSVSLLVILVFLKIQAPNCPTTNQLVLHFMSILDMMTSWGWFILVFKTRSCIAQIFMRNIVASFSLAPNYTIIIRSGDNSWGLIWINQSPFNW